MNRFHESIFVHALRFFYNVLEDFFRILCKHMKIVDKIDQEKFLVTFLRKARPFQKVKMPPVQNFPPITFIVVNQLFIVKLSRTNAQGIIGVEGGDIKVIVFQERLNKNVIIRWRIAK